MFRRFNPIILLAVASCATTNYGGELQPPISRMTGTPDEPESHVWVDTDRREVVVVAGPFQIRQTILNEAGGVQHGGHGAHDSSMRTPLIPVVWPVDGGLRGFKLGVFSDDGTPLPRTLIHHMNTLDFDRRANPNPLRVPSGDGNTTSECAGSSHASQQTRCPIYTPRSLQYGLAL